MGRTTSSSPWPSWTVSWRRAARGWRRWGALLIAAVGVTYRRCSVRPLRGHCQVLAGGLAGRSGGWRGRGGGQVPAGVRGHEAGLAGAPRQHLLSPARPRHGCHLDSVLLIAADTWQVFPGGLRLKRSHNYYYQIQGQMHITRRWCYSTCITYHPVTAECPGPSVTSWCGPRWATTWRLWAMTQSSGRTWRYYLAPHTTLLHTLVLLTNFKDTLENFYMNCLLPEIVDPRAPRGLPIREPDYIVQVNT